MREHSIPLEVQWNDIDYMVSLIDLLAVNELEKVLLIRRQPSPSSQQEFRDFTTDPSRFPLDQFKTFIDGLTANNQHYIPIIDAAIPAAPTNASDVYYPGSVGLEKDVFLKNANLTTYTASVWPGATWEPF